VKRFELSRIAARSFRCRCLPCLQTAESRCEVDEAAGLPRPTTRSFQRVRVKIAHSATPSGVAGMPCVVLRVGVVRVWLAVHRFLGGLIGSSAGTSTIVRLAFCQSEPFPQILIGRPVSSDAWQVRCPMCQGLERTGGQRFTSQLYWLVAAGNDSVVGEWPDGTKVAVVPGGSRAMLGLGSNTVSRVYRETGAGGGVALWSRTGTRQSSRTVAPDPEIVRGGIPGRRQRGTGGASVPVRARATVGAGCRVVSLNGRVAGHAGRTGCVAVS